MVIVQFSKYSHSRLSPEEIDNNLVRVYQNVCENNEIAYSWDDFVKRRTSSNRYCYDWETVSSERIIGKGSLNRVFNSIIIPWLKERLIDLADSQFNDSDQFNIIVINDDIYYYSFNIQRNNSIEFIVSKIKELVKINAINCVRINGPVDNTGRNFIENRNIYDHDAWIERAPVK